jgi:hypothetical protein
VPGPALRSWVGASNPAVMGRFVPDAAARRCAVAVVRQYAAVLASGVLRDAAQVLRPAAGLVFSVPVKARS